MGCTTKLPFLCRAGPGYAVFFTYGNGIPIANAGMIVREEMAGRISRDIPVLAEPRAPDQPLFIISR